MLEYSCAVSNGRSFPGRGGHEHHERLAGRQTVPRRRRRHQHRFAGFQGDVPLGGFDAPRAVDGDDDRPRPVRGRRPRPAFQAHAGQGKRVAGGEALDRPSLLAPHEASPARRRQRRRRSHGRQRFPHVQRPRPAVQAHAVPVVEAVRHVGGLLDLGQKHARPDGMDEAGGHPHEIARRHPPHVQQVRHAPFGDGRFQGVDRRAGHETLHDPRVRLGVEDDPALGLGGRSPCPVRRGRVARGVYLHAQAVGGVDELDQEGKRPRGAGRRRGVAEDGGGIVREEVRERPAGVGTLGNAAPTVRMVRQFPRLADTPIRRQGLAEHLGQTPPAPDALVEHRLHPERLHGGFLEVPVTCPHFMCQPL